MPQDFFNNLLRTSRVIEFMVHIFNACLTRCYFPHQWKVAEMIMIPKPHKDPKFLESYRPISMFTAVSKVVEIIFLLPVIEQKEVMPCYQFGFMEQLNKCR